MNEERIKKGLERFASKPDDALEDAAIGAAFLGCSERTLRYHPAAKRIYITPTRYNYQVGNLRQIASAGKQQPPLVRKPRRSTERGKMAS